MTTISLTKEIQASLNNVIVAIKAHLERCCPGREIKYKFVECKPQDDNFPDETLFLVSTVTRKIGTGANGVLRRIFKHPLPWQVINSDGMTNKDEAYLEKLRIQTHKKVPKPAIT